MSTSPSSLVDNLSEKLHSDKCKDCKSELDYMSVKDNQLIFQCLDTNSDTNGDTNKFVLWLRKGVYPYEYVDSWEIFDKTSLPDKNLFTVYCV